MSVMTPDDFPNYQNPDTNRWSHHLANDPYGGAAGAWAKQYYDNPNIDPNSAIQGQISAFRQRYGSAAPADDVGVMNMIASGQAPQQQAQTPAQQWNSGSVATGTGGTGLESQYGKELLELLMGRARQGLAVGRDDPTVRAQVDPMTAQMERASRNYIDDAAESGRGRPMNLEGVRQMMAERVGQSAGQLESEVIGREVGARRDDIRSSLLQWGDLLGADQRAAIERELGYLNDRARTADRSSAYEQFMRQLAQRDYEFNETLPYLGW